MKGTDVTTFTTDRLERGRRAYADVMTVAAPADSSPATRHLLDFVFAEVWQRSGLTRRERSMSRQVLATMRINQAERLSPRN